MKTGLLGRKLGHSYSPQIHAYLGDYPYSLFEREPEDVEEFLRSGDFDAINVTIPYKQTVIPYLDEIDDAAKAIGAVNTVVNRGGKLFGYNTDFGGLSALIEKTGIDIFGKKARKRNVKNVANGFQRLYRRLASFIIPIINRIFGKLGKLC